VELKDQDRTWRGKEGKGRRKKKEEISQAKEDGLGHAPDHLPFFPPQQIIITRVKYFLALRWAAAKVTGNNLWSNLASFHWLC